MCFNNRFDASSFSIGKIGSLPVCVSYDFYNAYPIVLHHWLSMVVNSLGVPVEFRNIVVHLYTQIFAYSSGCRDGSLLFQVLCGVRTGCSSCSVYLLLLSVNPLVGLFEWLSDDPSFSVTMVCADDFGSVFAQLYSLRTQASISRLATAVAGL